MARFGKDLLVFTGHDSLFTHALDNAAVGCISALANLFSPDLRQIWDAFQSGQSAHFAQERMEARRAVMERYPSAPAFIKALLSRQHGFPRWPLRPPLLPLLAKIEEQAARELRESDADGR